MHKTAGQKAEIHGPLEYNTFSWEKFFDLDNSKVVLPYLKSTVVARGSKSQ
jgi:hypothetical protein